jgi:hypothetical protein
MEVDLMTDFPDVEEIKCEIDWHEIVEEKTDINSR